MTRIVILLILFTLWTKMSVKEIDCEKQASLKKFPLRQFRISLDGNAKKGKLIYNLRQRQKDDELEKQREKANNEKISKDEAMRRIIYAENLLRFQGGSNILKDFVTNRFLKINILKY